MIMILMITIIIIMITILVNPQLLSNGKNFILLFFCDQAVLSSQDFLPLFSRVPRKNNLDSRSETPENKLNIFSLIALFQVMFFHL